MSSSPEVPPRVSGVLETALYVDDVARSREFYQALFGFEAMAADQRFCALAVGDRHVLLLFKKGGSLQPLATPGGVIPPSDGSGQMHFAFSIAAEALEAWERRLREKGIAIESKVQWERGGWSLYFRDPDGHLAELVTPGCWPIY